MNTVKMRNLDPTAIGMTELSQQEQRDVEGGILPALGAAVLAMMTYDILKGFLKGFKNNE